MNITLTVSKIEFYFKLTMATALLFISSQSFAASNDIPDISRVWSFGNCPGGDAFFNIGCMSLAEDDDRLTSRAKAFRDVFDEAAQPKYDCGPMSIPHMYTDPYSFRIEQLEDRVIVYYGKDDVVRTIWLEGYGHPEPAVNEFLYFGYAKGRYEDGALVVTTSKFTFDPQGLNADFRLPSSTQKLIKERFSREGENMILEVSTTDPFFLNQPWSFRVTSSPDNREFDPTWGCDAGASREILDLMESMYPDDPAIERIEY